MIAKKATVLFVYRHFSTFIERDLNVLEKRYKLILIHATNNVLKSLVKFLVYTPACDVIFVWFAGHQAFLSVLFAKFFRKKAVVIAGGYDAAYVPEIDYGVFICWWRGVLANFVYRYIDRILVVDQSLKRDIVKNTGLPINYKIETVPTGYDYNKWTPQGEKKEKLVVTVGEVNWSNLKRKGFETFVKAANHFSDVKFVLIGKHSDKSINYLKSIAPSNVDFPGFVSERKLTEYHQRAKVYCQLSRYEGLPNALCEAMLCECIPVGTKNCGIPTAIGNTGLYVPYGDVEATVHGIKRGLSSSLKRGKAARERIKKLFPSQRREKELTSNINDLSKSRPLT